MTELITEEKCCKYLNCTTPTLRRYLCRAEFNHIERVIFARDNCILKNITDKDKEKLNKLINRLKNQIRS